MTARLALCGVATAMAAAMLLSPGPVAAQMGDDMRAGLGGVGENGGAFGQSNDFGVAHVQHYDATAEYAKGKAALQVGDFREAQQDFDNSLSVDRDNPDTLFMLGTARAGAGDLRGAVRAYEKSLRFNDKPIIVRREYAIALAKLGQADKAQAQFAILKARSDACGGTCSEAADLNTALTAVQAAMPPPGAAASGHS